MPPAPPPEPIIPIGASAAGLDVGGLTLTDAAAKLQHTARATPPAPDGGRYVDVPLHVTYRGADLNAFVAAVDRDSQVIPRNARLRMTVRRMFLRRARMGWSIDEKALVAQLDPVLADLRHQYRTVVTVDRKRFKLRYFRNLKRRKTYDVAVGMPGHATPRGRFSITDKAVDPDWTAPDEPWAGAYRNEVVAIDLYPRVPVGSTVLIR